MASKNDVFLAVCQDYTYDGMGVVFYEDFPYFVKGLLKGEKARFKIIKINKNYGIAIIAELLETSPYRVTPPCPVYKQCGGCQLLHMADVEQKRFKTRIVKDVMRKIAKDDVRVTDTLMMDEPWHYRNKAQLPCAKKEGRIYAGFYKRHSHEIIAHERCLIQSDLSNQIVTEALTVLSAMRVSCYDEKNHTGWLRHLFVRVSHDEKEAMLVVITSGPGFFQSERFIREMTQRCPALRTIAQNINTRNDNVILGNEQRILYGPGYIEDHVEDLVFRISAKSFYQVNPEQMVRLYSTALKFAGLTGQEVVIDAYCGIGTIALFFAKHAKKVIGVEIVAAAVQDAMANARASHIDNVEFVQDDAGHYMRELAAKKFKTDVVVCDPPRKGCSREFLDALVTLHPKKVVYISCHPATQARDIAILKEHDYVAQTVEPVDMFPQTYGIETVALLTRLDEKEWVPCENQ